VIHGDIKGTNVLVDSQGCPKLCDFGLAKTLEENPSGLTTAEVFVGSTRWLAVELLSENSRTRQSDIWAFGHLIIEVCIAVFSRPQG
jgi:serine/threonine protein kinase